MDKIWINLNSKSIGGVNSAKGFKEQIEKLRAELKGDTDAN